MNISWWHSNLNKVNFNILKHFKIICNRSDVNKMTQPSLIHRNTDLTMINGPKYLYENSRIQLRSCHASGINKAEDSSIETDKKNHLNLPASTSTPNLHSSVLRENAPVCDYFLMEKLRVKPCYGFFEELSEALVSVSPHLEDWQNEYTLHLWGPQKTKKNGGWLVAANTVQHK